MEANEVDAAQPPGPPESASPEIPAPYVGQLFPSFDAAFSYIVAYCQSQQHACRRGRVRNCSDEEDAAGGPRARYIVCTCEGKPKPTKSEDTRSIRTQCKFGVNVYNRGAAWEVKNVNLVHNHPPLAAPVVSSLKFRGKPPPEELRQLVITLDDAGLSARHIHTVLEKVFREDARTWTEEDVRTILSREGREKASDAAKLFGILKECAEGEVDFFLKWEADSQLLRVRRFFWMSPAHRSNIARFGDVIFVNASLVSNRFQRPLIHVTGVNDEGQACFLGIALVESDTHDDIAWTLSALKQGGYEAAPNVLYTCTRSASATAAADVFPSARHLVCPWQLAQDAAKSVGAALGEHFAALLADLTRVRKLDSSAEFDTAFASMCADARYAGPREFLASLHAIKEKWAACYVREVAGAGVRSSRRMEILGAFIRLHAMTATRIGDFVVGADMAYGKDGTKTHSLAHATRPLHADIHTSRTKTPAEEAARTSLSTFAADRIAREIVESAAYVVQATDQTMPLQGLQGPVRGTNAPPAAYADPQHVFGLGAHNMHNVHNMHNMHNMQPHHRGGGAAGYHYDADAPPELFPGGGDDSGEASLGSLAAKAAGGCRDACASIFVHAVMQPSATAVLIARGASDVVGNILSSPIPVGSLRTFRVALQHGAVGMQQQQQQQQHSMRRGGIGAAGSASAVGGAQAHSNDANAAGRVVSFVRIGQLPGDYVKRCSCRASTFKGLPCRHIFAVESHLKLHAGLDFRIVSDRWQRASLQQIGRAILSARIKSLVGTPAAAAAAAAAQHQHHHQQQQHAGGSEDALGPSSWQHRTRAMLLARMSHIAGRVTHWGGDAEAAAVVRRLESIERMLDEQVDDEDDGGGGDAAGGGGVREEPAGRGRRGRPAKRPRLAGRQNE